MFTRAIKIIKRYCDFLQLKENVIKQVEEMYHEIQDQKELKGKRLEIIVTGIIYLVCKRNKIPIHTADLEPLANVPQTKISKIINVIVKFVPSSMVHAHEYIPQFCARLLIPNEHTDLMRKMCQLIEQYDFFNMQLPKPKTIAAAVMHYYLQNGDPKLKKTITEIKDVAGIKTDNTIKKYVQIIEEKRGYFQKLFDTERADAAERGPAAPTPAAPPA